MAEEVFNEDEELEKIKNKKNELSLTSKINESVAQYYDSTIANNGNKMQALTNKLFDAEVEVAENKIEGKKKVLNSQTEKEVTEAKTEEDKAKHERAKTILKAQGLTDKMPTAFRVTALIIGYPFFVLYLITFGWITEFITFVIKGLTTMIFDCADRVAELNKKFVANGNDKQFKLGQSIFNILKWMLIVGAVIAIIILLASK